MNRRIRVPEVRVIAEDGSQLGVIPTHEALRLAEEKGLDLVEVSPKAQPPVCRVMDYGKFKYEQSKKTKQAKKHSSAVEVKEIKFRPKTDDHDLDFKLRHVRRFLEEGNKVRLAVQFRGREIVHPETGRAVLDRVLKACTDIAHIEQIPLLEGRRMIMVISPRPGAFKPPLGAPASASAPAPAPAPATPGAPASAGGAPKPPQTTPPPAGTPSGGPPQGGPPPGGPPVR